MLWQVKDKKNSSASGICGKSFLGYSNIWNNNLSNKFLHCVVINLLIGTMIGISVTQKTLLRMIPCSFTCVNELKGGKEKLP